MPLKVSHDVSQSLQRKFEGTQDSSLLRIAFAN
jgi:hypothetical protein